MRYIYSGDETIITSIPDLDQLLEIYRLADKYFLAELKALAKTTAEKLPVSSKNYAHVFKTVADYQDLLGFEELCKDMKQRCVLAVSQEWRSVKDCVRFWGADLGDDRAAKLELFQQIADIEATVVCEQCRAADSLVICDDGQPLTASRCKTNGFPVRAATNLTCPRGGAIASGTSGVVVWPYLVNWNSVAVAISWNGFGTWNGVWTVSHVNLEGIVVRRH